jgi:hypothetical protein
VGAGRAQIVRVARDTPLLQRALRHEHQAQWQSFIQRGVIIVLDDGAQGVAFRKRVPLLYGETFPGNRSKMPHHRARLVPDAVSRQAQPPPQVNILKIGDERFVKATQRHEQVAPDEH